MTGVAAIILAAGASARYRAGGGRFPNKVVAPFEGEPMIRRAVRAALEGGCTPVLVVTGFARDAVADALAGLNVATVHNPDFATGLASSLRAGLQQLGDGVGAVVILLGDMPLVDGRIVRRLVEAAAAHPEAPAVVPMAGGQRGNPVLLARVLFSAASTLSGDEGARRLLRDPALAVLEVATDDAVRLDVDEPGAAVP